MERELKRRANLPFWRPLMERAAAQTLERIAAKQARDVKFYHQKKRKQAIERATPGWANRAAISKIYSRARIKSHRTGRKFVVDHVIPLQGRKVCGLHVHENLRVISSRDNSKKHCRFDP